MVLATGSIGVLVERLDVVLLNVVVEIADSPMQDRSIQPPVPRHLRITMRLHGRRPGSRPGKGGGGGGGGSDEVRRPWHDLVIQSSGLGLLRSAGEPPSDSASDPVSSNRNARHRVYEMVERTSASHSVSTARWYGFTSDCVRNVMATSGMVPSSLSRSDSSSNWRLQATPGTLARAAQAGQRSLHAARQMSSAIKAKALEAHIARQISGDSSLAITAIQQSSGKPIARLRMTDRAPARVMAIPLGKRRGGESGYD